jgi:hypothetical protein
MGKHLIREVRAALAADLSQIDVLHDAERRDWDSSDQKIQGVLSPYLRSDIILDSAVWCWIER